MSPARSLRALLATVMAMMMALALAGTAAAAAPKFHSATSGVNTAGALVVTFDERGLGNTDVHYTLTADAEAVYACINRGGKNPEAANKQTVQGQVSTGGTFEVKNGRVQASLTTGPLSAGDFSCPRGQNLVLAKVTYTNIVLTDTSNNVSTDVDDASRTLFAV